MLGQQIFFSYAHQVCIYMEGKYSYNFNIVKYYSNLK